MLLLEVVTITLTWVKVIPDVRQLKRNKTSNIASYMSYIILYDGACLIYHSTLSYESIHCLCLLGSLHFTYVSLKCTRFSELICYSAIVLTMALGLLGLVFGVRHSIPP